LRSETPRYPRVAPSFHPASEHNPGQHSVCEGLSFPSGVSNALRRHLFLRLSLLFAAAVLAVVVLIVVKM
jgi:hypothetical protein